MLLTPLSPSISNNDLDQSQTDALKGILSQLGVLLNSITVKSSQVKSNIVRNVLDTNHGME